MWPRRAPEPGSFVSGSLRVWVPHKWDHWRPGHSLAPHGEVCFCFTYTEVLLFQGWVYCLETGMSIITRGALLSIGRVSMRKLTRLWPSSALSICQYTNRHPVHLLGFFILSSSLLSTLRNEIVLCSACGHLIVSVLWVCLGVRVRGKVCHLRLLWLPARVLCPYGRGGVAGCSPPVTISVNTASKHTLYCTGQPGTHRAGQVFNTVSSNIM